MADSIYTVYKVTNKQTGMAYVGCTRKTLAERYGRHVRAALSDNVTTPKTPLGLAIIELGAAAFSLEPISVWPTREAGLAAEIEAIGRFGTVAPDGYNNSYGGDGIAGWGKRSPISRNNQMGKRKGIPFSEDHKAALIETHWSKNPEIADATKAKISTAHTGLVMSESAKAKLIVALQNRVVSDETRALRSIANKGKRLTEETKKKLSDANVGKTHTQETRDKMSRVHTQARQNESPEKQERRRAALKAAWVIRRARASIV